MFSFFISFYETLKIRHYFNIILVTLKQISPTFVSWMQFSVFNHLLYSLLLQSRQCHISCKCHALLGDSKPRTYVIILESDFSQSQEFWDFVIHPSCPKSPCSPSHASLYFQSGSFISSPATLVISCPLSSLPYVFVTEAKFSQISLY